MKVTLLNPNEVKNLFFNWGTAAQVCYDSSGSPEKTGQHCMKSGHFSGSRGDFIKFLVTDVPRFTVDQTVRHEIGVFKNVQSFRYVGKEGFAYEVPSEIIDNPELLKKYDAFMMTASNLYSEIQEYVFNKTGSHERANEQARHVVPMSTHTSFVIGFTLEAFIHFMNVRLCVRAEEAIRKLAIKMKNCTLEVLPEVKDKLVPSCQNYLWCPEGKKGCGAYPTKEQLLEVLNANSKNCNN